MNRRKTVVAGHLSSRESAVKIINFVSDILDHLSIKYTLSKVNGYYYVYYWLTKEQYTYVCNQYKNKYCKL